jgi:hypothetical protein
LSVEDDNEFEVIASAVMHNEMGGARLGGSVVVRATVGEINVFASPDVDDEGEGDLKPYGEEHGVVRRVEDVGDLSGFRDELRRGSKESPGKTAVVGLRNASGTGGARKETQ